MKLEPNIPMFRKIFDVIEEDTSKWNQSSWCRATSCGTQMCIAGWACYLNGDELCDPKGLTAVDLRRNGYKGDLELAYVRTEHGTRTVEDQASQILGLTPVQAQRIFYKTPGGFGVEVAKAHVEQVIGCPID